MLPRVPSLASRALVVASVILPIVFAAASRLVGNYVPASGHMLFLTYSALTTTPKWYRAFAAVLLVVATVFKLAVTGDTEGWTVGLAMGVVAAVM